MRSKILSLYSLYLFVFFFTMSLSFANDTLPLPSKITNEPEVEHIEFDIFRKNERIGEHITSIYRHKTETQINSNMKIRIKFLGFTIYKFDYSSQETWKDGLLKNLSTNVNDDGQKTLITAQYLDNEFTVKTNAQQYTTSAPLYTSNHWNFDITQQNHLLNTLTGKINKIKLIPHGEEIIMSRQGPLSTKKYEYTGDLNNTFVWYDKNKRWVKLKFKAKDGNFIEYICRNCLNAAYQ